MAKSKKTTKTNSAAKRSRKVKGFDERRAGADWRPLLGLGADILQNFIPGGPILRKIAGGVLGFDERRVETPRKEVRSSPSESGGPVVQTMNAPVAFARNEVRSSKRKLGETDDGEVWQFTDLAATVSTSSGAVNTFAINQYRCLPIASGTFPNYFTEAEMWEKWRPLRGILHFCHFAATSAVAAVMLAYCDDANGSEATAQFVSTSSTMALTHSAQGSAYEDFSLEFVPETWKEGTWFYNDTSNGADLRLNYPGSIAVATDMNSATSQALGFFYVELFFEVSGKRAPYVGVGILYSLRDVLPLIPEENREAFAREVLGQIGQTMLKSVHSRPSHPGAYNRMLEQYQDWCKEEPSFTKPSPAIAGITAGLKRAQLTQASDSVPTRRM